MPLKMQSLMRPARRDLWLYPTDGVHDVGLAAAVRPDDACGTGAAERHHGAFAERFESCNFDFAEF